MKGVLAPAGVNVEIAGVLLFLSFVMGFQRPCRVALVLLKPQNCVLCHSAPFSVPFLSVAFLQRKPVFTQENPAKTISDRIEMDINKIFLISVFQYTVRFPYFTRIDHRICWGRFSAIRLFSSAVLPKRISGVDTLPTASGHGAPMLPLDTFELLTNPMLYPPIMVK